MYISIKRRNKENGSLQFSRQEKQQQIAQQNLKYLISFIIQIKKKEVSGDGS